MNIIKPWVKAQEKLEKIFNATKLNEGWPHYNFRTAEQSIDLENFQNLLKEKINFLNELDENFNEREEIWEIIKSEMQQFVNFADYSMAHAKWHYKQPDYIDLNFVRNYIKNIN